MTTQDRSPETNPKLLRREDVRFSLVLVAGLIAQGVEAQVSFSVLAVAIILQMISRSAKL